MIQDVLKGIGLHEIESQIYLACLEYGPQTATQLARRVKVPRTTVYGYLTRMIEKGYVHTVPKVTGDLFGVIQPSDLIGLLDQGIDDIERKKKLVRENLVAMNSVVRKNAYMPRIKYFEGADALAHVYQTASTTKTMYAYVNIDALNEHAEEYNNRIAKIMDRDDILAKELVFDNEGGREYKEKHHSPDHQIRLMKKEILFYADNIILDDRAFHVSFGEPLIAVEIINPVWVNSQRLIFELAWEGQE